MTYRMYVTLALAIFPAIFAASPAVLAADAPDANAPEHSPMIITASPPPASAGMPAVMDQAPQNVPPATAVQGEPPTPPAAAQPERKPLMVIRFNQYHVYFDRALRQVVASAEKAKPGTLYDVVAYTPAVANPAKTDRQSSDTNANLQAVVQQMESMGVSGDRIHTSTIPSGDVTYPEIRIYVN